MAAEAVEGEEAEEGEEAGEAEVEEIEEAEEIGRLVRLHVTAGLVREGGRVGLLAVGGPGVLRSFSARPSKSQATFQVAVQYDPP
jgi:hypothetical protein